MQWLLDALSKVVMARTEEKNGKSNAPRLTRFNIKTNQHQDADLSKIIDCIQQGKDEAPYFLDNDGLLYRVIQ